MIKFLKYDFKRHLNTSLLICLFVGLATIMSQVYYEVYVSSYRSVNELINFIYTLVFIAMRFGILALFIYFGNDFVRNITMPEKNLIFTSPYPAYKFLFAKFLSVTLSCLMVYITLMISSLVANIIYGRYVIGGLGSSDLMFLLMLFSYCLVALMMQHTSILLTKGLLEKTKFKYIWIPLFAIVFAIYFTLSLLISRNDAKQPLDFFPWPVLIVNFATSAILFLANSYAMDKKMDF